MGGGAAVCGTATAVTVQRGIIMPTVTDEDIALLRQDLRAKKMQVIGQNMGPPTTRGRSSGRCTTIT